jgi:formyltetrahydrofolate synthetase
MYNYFPYKLKKISEIAYEPCFSADNILPHGHYFSKFPIDHLQHRLNKPDGNLILLKTMNLKQREEETTTSIGIGDSLRQLCHKTRTYFGNLCDCYCKNKSITRRKGNRIFINIINNI